MKWRTVMSNPEVGDTRERKFFAWRPVVVYLNGTRETRWLETVNVVETFRVSRRCLKGGGGFVDVGVWQTTRFIQHAMQLTFSG